MKLINIKKKKIIFLLITATLFAACNKLEENEFIVSGTAEGIADGKLAILETLDESGMGVKPTDTAFIKNGKFEFKGIATEPELRFIQIDSIQGKAVFVLENGEISIKAFKDSINKTIIGGTYNNDQFATYNKEQTAIQKKIADFRTANKEKMDMAVQSNDSVTINNLRDTYVKLNDELKDYNIKFADTNPKAFISVLMIQNMLMQPGADFEKLEKTYNNLDKTVRNTKPGKSVGELIANRSSAEVGNAAPEFSAPNPDGKMVSLKESLGKVTIIDFWASWCGPCRRENPNVVALYNELHDKGLNIIGISLDKEGDSQKWKDAIVADKLTWPQVSNLQYWNEPIAKKYNVQSIPATFILDASGKIVAKDLRGEELKAKVMELLGS